MRRVSRRFSFLECGNLLPLCYILDCGTSPYRFRFATRLVSLWISLRSRTALSFLQFPAPLSNHATSRTALENDPFLLVFSPGQSITMLTLHSSCSYSTMSIMDDQYSHGEHGIFEYTNTGGLQSMRGVHTYGSLYKLLSYVMHAIELMHFIQNL